MVHALEAYATLQKRRPRRRAVATPSRTKNVRIAIHHESLKEP